LQKPENILLDGNLRIKICDFGMAALMPKDALLATSCGSPHYASPEVITGRKYNGMEADIWSLGVILYALLVGKLPFDDPNMRKLLLKVKIGVFEMPPHLDKTAKDLLWRMLTVDADKRATIAEIKQHPWFLSNGGPPGSNRAPLDVDKVVPFHSTEELDTEVVQTLTALWGDEESVLADLMADDSNLTKVFYRLIQERFSKRVEEEKSLEPPPTPVVFFFLSFFFFFFFSFTARASCQVVSGLGETFAVVFSLQLHLPLVWGARGRRGGALVSGRKSQSPPLASLSGATLQFAAPFDLYLHCGCLRSVRFQRAQNPRAAAGKSFLF
jgi:serine/threonine protein kinase